MLRRFARLGHHVAMTFLPFAVVGGYANECVPELPYATSSVAVQVWDRQCGMVPRAEVSVVDGRGGSVASGRTDDSGYLLLAGVPSGEYQILVSTNAFPIFSRRVRVRRSSEFPGQTLLIALGVGGECHQSCTGAAGGPRRIGPRCLFRRSCPRG